MHIGKKILYSFSFTMVFFAAIEWYLGHIEYEGSSIEDLVQTSGFPDNAYVHQRDRILGDWFLPTQSGYRSNPALLERGFHNQSFSKQDTVIFAMGGSTTYGSPFEHEEKGFPERLEKTLSHTKVINAGVAGMDSSAFPAMSKQLARIGGKGVIIYTGNNEMRGALLRLCLDTQHNALADLRIYRFVLDQYRQLRGVQYQFQHLARHQEDCIQDAVHSVLSQPTDSYDIPRQDKFYTDMRTEFHTNLSKTIHTFSQANMHVWLVIPPINLLEPPAFSAPNPVLDTQTHTLIKQLEQEKNWDNIVLLDPTHAKANFELGIQKNNHDLLTIAAQRDYATQRITPELQDTIATLCAEYPTQTTCIDLRTFEKENNKSFFHDFCHPTKAFGVHSIVQSIQPHIQ